MNVKCQFSAAFFFNIFYVGISTQFLKCKKENENQSPYKVKMIDVQT
jgi:hypothetical protein